MRKTKVLIIGAGPTGLMAACQLQRQGIDFIIVDKKDGPTQESRALVIHARSLEIYDQMGISAEAVKQGQIVQTVQFIVKGRKIQEMPLGIVGEGLSAFPFLLVLEQSRNEELHYKYLQEHNGEVLWNTELILLQQQNHSILGTLR
ncbi:MAG: FAD-dependent monooxygenase, partial [Chitinophagaceae bacterium]|nr:FAD-dependent monooxygenase [Chitinophagaceae bacterium]